jgi:anti-sigma regulatory factor (Ser/Thr protein kinase)
MESIKEAAAIALEDDTQISVARRTASLMCPRLGLSESFASQAELVCVELSTNILRHAGRGHLYLAGTPAGGALQVIACDKGRGIGNVALAMQDGFSTSTTPGLGLGAVRRIVQEMDIYSRPGLGTVVSAIVGPGSLPAARSSVLSTCIAGEKLNGDSWAIHHVNAFGKDAHNVSPRELYLVVDGLGHGLYASEAVTMATSMVAKAMADDPGIPLTNLLNQMHGPMRATRGAAIAIVSVANGFATCCGVGNVSVLLHNGDGTAKTVLSHNGTLGHQMHRLQEFNFPVHAGTVLVMHSDGIATHWKMAQYPGLLESAPSTIAGVLYRDAVRGRDDATILVARIGDAGRTDA